MKKILLVLCISFSLPPCFGQDYLITWADDTIQCVLPADPAKEGLKPASQYRNGYRSVTAILGKDSIRVVQAGEIKGYYRQVHGKNLLCDGHFKSVRISEGDITMTNSDGRKSVTWRFMALDQSGKYASLYKIMQWGSRLNTYYYVVKHDGNGEPFGNPIITKKSAGEALADKDIEEDMLLFIKNNKKYGDMVAEYNRLKELAADKQKSGRQP